MGVVGNIAELFADETIFLVLRWESMIRRACLNVSRLPGEMHFDDVTNGTIMTSASSSAIPMYTSSNIVAKTGLDGKNEAMQHGQPQYAAIHGVSSGVSSGV